MLPGDNHVHSEWSWDASLGSMERSCEEALRIGLPSIAFTEHADFVTVHSGQRPLDIDGYREAVEQCRARFPDLRILTGIELGEPHWFATETAAVLAQPLDRVLASVHCVRVSGLEVDASQFRREAAANLPGALRLYFAETLALVNSSIPFQVLAHIDYPKRYVEGYRDEDHEEELRAILDAAVRRDCVLEVNTTRGDRLCPGPTVVAWWHELGGEAVSFGSDAHEPSRIAGGFKEAAAMVEAAGFKPSDDPAAFWRR